MIETYILAIIAAAPSIVSILGIITAVVKMIKAGKTNNTEVITKLEEVRQEVFNAKEFETLKDQLYLAHKENCELKKKLNELLTKIDHIARKE